MRLLRLCGAALLAACMYACGHVAVAEESSGVISLSLEGYNYTDRYIDYFSVNGQGGGNIYVSSPTSGGGGTVCCVLYHPRGVMKSVIVRWQSGGCYFTKHSSLSNKPYDKLHSFFKEQDVPVEVLAATDAGGTFLSGWFDQGRSHRSYIFTAFDPGKAARRS